MLTLNHDVNRVGVDLRIHHSPQQNSAGAAPVAVLCAAASEANRIRQLQIAERAQPII
jgi:hypothetical protein